MNELVTEQAPSSGLQPVAPKNEEDRIYYALTSAIDKGMDAESLQRIMGMQITMADRKSEQAFNKAMLRAQQKMPPVVADADNSQTRSRYPKLANITKVCSPVYFKYGFNCSFDTAESPIEDCIRVVCYVSHKDGHTRQYHLDVPIDVLGPKGNPVKTKTHGVISAVTYGQSRLMRMIWNVRVLNDPEDDDGNAAGAKPVKMITAEQALDLETQLQDLKIPVDEFCKRQKVESLEALPASVLPLVQSQLDNRRAKMEKAS